MSDLLCRWLNQELRLSKFVEPQTLARDFSTGYLIGEVLFKYQLQTDFRMFTKKDTSISKVNNFTRLEPTLQLLGITFDINTAQELMQEKHGVATRLLYHLYTALGKKKRAEMTETMVEIMQPAAIANLHKREHDNYTDRLHQIVKRDAELKLMKIAQHYEEKCQQLIHRSVTIHSFQLKSTLKIPEERKKHFEKLRTAPQKTTNIGPIDQIAIIPKPPPYTKQLNLKKRRYEQQQLRREQLAKTVQNEIAEFELSRKKMVSSGVPSSLGGQPVAEYYVPSWSSYLDMQGSKAHLILQSNLKYMQEIRNRLEESAMAREQREKRRDRFLLEQLQIHEAQEEARRDEHLVKRLTRQTQQEQRVASQLLQMRMQKAVISQNRLFREQQYQQRKERDIKEALEREAALAEQAKLDRAKEIQKELEFFKKIAAERTRRKYEKHFKLCKDIVEQILDLSTKIGEYRLITANLIPEKMMREWKELVLNGLPLYEQPKGLSPTYELYTPLDTIECRRLEVLNNQNFDEYMEMVGDWVWPEEAGELKQPPPNNNILGHIMHRLKNIIHPPLLESTSPSLPHYTIKACVLGNLCSGKTRCLAKIAEEFGVCVLSPDTLVEEALNAHIIGEQLSARAALGGAAMKELIKGQGIPNDVIVDIVVEAIRHVPAHSGWILDGFPMDINQAYLFEKALGGSVEVGGSVERKRSELAFGPNPPHTLGCAEPVLDMVVLLDVPDGAVIRRAFSHTDSDPATETALSPTEKNLYLAQVPQRITAFRDTWPRLGEWYGEKQNILVTIEANVDEDELYDRLAGVLQPVLTHKPDVTQCAEEVSCATESVPHGKKKKGQRINQLKPRRSSIGSLMSENGHRGQNEYAVSPRVFVDESLPPEIPEYLCSNWETVCESYVNNIRRVLQLLRSQSNFINHHLYNTREDFKHFLGRPDVKQEFVSQWQKDFNSVPDDMRDDEETKAELHLRLDELRERLLDISEKRKEQNEKERSSIIHEGWLDDHVAVLVNHHSSLIQAEINKLQESICIFRVYYSSMAGEVIFEPFSNFIYVPLLGSTEINVHFDYSIDTEDTEKKARPTEGDEGKKVKFSLQCLPKFIEHPMPKSQSQLDTDPVKHSQEKLNFEYEEAVKAIGRLVSAEIHQGELKEPEKPPEKEPEKPPEKGKTKKGKQSAKEQKEPEPPPPPPTAVYEGRKIEFTCDLEVRKILHKEYIAALEHEEKATKVKISLVKGHGLVMMQQLQAGAEKVFQAMHKWLEANYHAEIKSIDQLTEVVRHHIETGAKLQNELILECSDFYMNGDCHMVPTPAPPTQPPPLEKPTPYTLTIRQLETLYQHLSYIAPSGLMSSSEFSDLLRDITSVNTGRTMLPERWIDLSDKQLIEIVSLLMDQYELVDWRQFLLSAALPWPFPSLTQLLEVLQRFKAADVENTGCVNSEQYLQTELWFSSKNDQPVSQDHSGAPPFDRLSNLHKFFFQLFADHSLSPPQLDYVSMLQYFAADPNPKQCFVRLLSVILGQALLLPSEEELVKSMPVIKDSSVSLIEPDGETKGSPSASTTPVVESGVSISALLTVLCHKVTRLKGHRALPPGCPSEEEHIQNLAQVFTELGYEPEDCVPFSVLSRHLFIQDLMLNPAHYKLVNLHGVLQPPQEEESFIKEE